MERVAKKIVKLRKMNPMMIFLKNINTRKIKTLKR